MNLIEDINQINSALSTKNYRWRRYWAKQIDLLLVFIVVTFVGAMLVEDPSTFLVYALAVAGVVVYETALLSQFQTTIGKKLLGISVRTTNGQKLSFDDALVRSWYCQALGNGFCVPTVSMIMNALSFSALGKTGLTRWDQKAGTSVEITPITIARKLSAALLILGFYGFFVAIAILADQAGR